MTRRLRIRKGNLVEDLWVENGSRIIDALAIMDGATVETPCGGKGLCGKCRIVVVAGTVSAPDKLERRRLSAMELASGERLACEVRIEGDVEVELPEQGAPSIVSFAPQSRAIPDPPVRIVVVSPQVPGLENQSDDETRLLEAIALEYVRTGYSALPPRRVALEALPALARLCRGDSPILVGAVIADGELIGIVPVRPGARTLGIGVDVGTTTMVCRLIDLGTGVHLGSLSELNAQRSFGADVISRIEAARSPEGFESLRNRIRIQIAAMTKTLVEASGGAGDDLICFAVAGNSTMLHLLSGVSPDAMASSPFTPAFLKRRIESAAALGFVDRPGCAAILLPGISAYVGSDIIAGITAIGLHKANERSIFLDLGTNGEIAFGGLGGILCCATAAGPAFEGAGIEKGIGGIAGAIDSVWIEDGALRFGTIGNAPSTGICGSGIVDAAAVLLDCGIVDSSGRMLEESEAHVLPPQLSVLISTGSRGPIVYLDRGRGIYLSQADIRAIQLAKAAIAAGMATLLALSGVATGDVDRLYLAGGFGSLLDARSAARIGLIPPGLENRTVVVGNVSCAGATEACLSRASLEACDRACELCSYVELSSRADFIAAYIEAMMFPEQA